MALHAASEVSGQKFYYLRNAGALLELALVNWAMARVAARGFTPYLTPDLVKAEVLERCGFQPRGQETQVGLWRGWVDRSLTSTGACCVRNPELVLKRGRLVGC